MTKKEHRHPKATKGPQNSAQPSMDPATGLPTLPAYMRWHIEPLVLGLHPLTIELQKWCGLVWVEVCSGPADTTVEDIRAGAIDVLARYQKIHGNQMKLKEFTGNYPPKNLNQAIKESTE